MNRRDTLKLLLTASGGTILSPPFAAAFQPAASPAPPPALEKNTAGPVFTWLTLGEVKPAGWIKEQMLRDLSEGFAGHLGDLCHEASSDIFVSHRNSAASANAGNVYHNHWWNGETEGNWRAGFIMMAYLAEDKQAMQRPMNTPIISYHRREKTVISGYSLQTFASLSRANFGHRPV